MMQHRPALNNLFRLSAAALLLTAPAFAAGISASASFSAASDPTTAGVYDYTLTLNNTGTTTIGTFWFAWVPGAGFLPDTPTSVSSPAGWSASLKNSGHSIQWVAAAPLQPGQSLSGFVFDSIDSPAQLQALYSGTGTGAGDPIDTAFVYAGAPNVGTGSQFVVPQVTPEPSSLLLLATGLLGGAGTFYRRLRPNPAIKS